MFRQRSAMVHLRIKLLPLGLETMVLTGIRVSRSARSGAVGAEVELAQPHIKIRSYVGPSTSKLMRGCVHHGRARRGYESYVRTSAGMEICVRAG